MEDGLEGWWERRAEGIRNAVIALGAFMLVDIVVAILLLEASNNWGTDIWAPENFFNNFFAFQDRTSDCLILVFIRVVCIVALASVAYVTSYGEKEVAAREYKSEQENEQPLLSIHKSDLEQPLVSPSASISDARDLRASRAEREEELVRVSDKRDRYQALFLAASFCILTLFQLHAGLKCVSFNFTHETIQGVFMAAPVFIVNAQLWGLEKLVKWLTIGEGYLWKDTHSHRMYFKQLKCHWCDMCRSRINNGYRCGTCDFDMCMDCFYKKNKSHAEGVLRGDKGVRANIELTNSMYMMRALRLAAPHWSLMLVAFLCLLATTASSLFLPNFQGTILDNVIQMDKDKFLTNIYLYLMLSVAVGFFGGLRTLCFNIMGRKMSNNITVELFENMVFQDIAYFDGTTTGQLTSRLTNDINQMVSPMQTMLNTLLSNLILLVGGLIMCFYTSWRLSMLAFTTVGPIMYITNSYAVWSQGIYRDILAAMADANSTAVQAIGNIRTVRAFSTELTEIARYVEATTQALRKGIRDAIVGGGTFALTNYLDLGTGVLVLWYGGTVCMEPDSHLQVGNLITFQLYWNMINASYTALQGVLSSFTRAAGAAQRVLSIIDTTPDIGPKGGIELVRDQVKGDITLEDVHFAYQMRPDQKVLKGINLEIKAGQTIALVGRSGGGKSTLVHLLMRFYDPKEGRILLDGRNICDINLLSLHGIMGLVQQETQLFALSIEQNIGYGTPNYTQQQVEEAAKLANCHDFIMEFEDGYETRVGERGVRLSGGQKQRIAIARVLLRRPRLLFLDEATSALDTESEAAVQAALDNLIKLAGCTVILVAHRLSTVVNADKIAVIHSGEIVEHGTHSELVAKGGAYYRLVSRQITREKNVIDHDGTNKKEMDVIDALLTEEEEEKNPDKAKLKNEVDMVDSLVDEEYKEAPVATKASSRRSSASDSDST